MSSFTPGPWKYKFDSGANSHGAGYYISAEGKAPIATTPDKELVDEANAKLIAAAPELLAYCRLAKVNYHGMLLNCDDSDIREILETSIAGLNELLAKATQ